MNDTPINTDNLDKRENIDSTLTQQTALSDLPLEMIYCIFGQLSAKMIQNLNCVSKQWSAIITGCLSITLQHDVAPLLKLFQNIFGDSYKSEYEKGQSIFESFCHPSHVRQYQLFKSKIKTSIIKEWKMMPAKDLDKLEKESNVQSKSFKTDVIELTVIHNQIEIYRNIDNLDQGQKNLMLTGFIFDLIRHRDFDKAKETINDLSPEYRDKALSLIIDKFMKSNNLNLAEEFIYLLSNSNKKKYNYLFKIFEKHLESNNLDQATELICLLSKETPPNLLAFNINDGIEKLVKKYITIGNFEKAEKIANHASHALYGQPLKDQLFQAILIELRKKGRFDQADELFEKISSQPIKVEVFKTMIEQWVADGKYAEAYHRIINTFKDNPEDAHGQSYLLRFMVKKLIKKQDFKEAKWYADLIQDKEVRKEILDQIPKNGVLHTIKNLFSG